MLPIAKLIVQMNFKIVATKGTCDYLKNHGIPVEFIFKVNEGVQMYWMR